MKVWKSPVFYFGILLVAAVVALLVAPFVVNWNGYRADLEAYGRKLSGREITIEGNIAARLFPWPKLTVEGVRVANPPGLTDPEFAHAGRVVVRMSLAGLLQGAIEVESIDIENPVIAVERLASGKGNWHFTPAADLLKSDLLARVRLDSITIRDGVVRFTDRRRGEVHQLDDVNASFAAPAISGPWRMRSLSLYEGHAIDIAFNTGVWKEAEPLRYSVRLANADSSGFVFTFDGAEADGKSEGELRIEPASGANGKEDAEGQLRPLVFKSKISATFDQVNLDGIEIAPRELKDGGTLMSGSAKLKLGPHITASADLSAATLDLDAYAGAQARLMLREGGVLNVADGLLRLLPPDLSLSGGLKVTALKAGGETLDNVALMVEADRNAIRLRELSASLPGRSRALYQGIFFPGKGGAELAGSLALESSDLRQLVSWAWPEGRERVLALWTGSRGRFKMQSDISLTPSRLRFSKTEFEIDGERGTAEFTRTVGGRDAYDIRLGMGKLDVDNLVAPGTSPLAAMGADGVAGALGLLVPSREAADLRLTLQAGEFLLNGMAAKALALDLASGVTGLDLRTLEIGDVGGARVVATGLILGTGAGPDGSIALDVKAGDPRGLLRLAGLMAGDTDPVWATGLGETALKARVTLKPGQEGKPATSFDIDGTAGDIGLSASGDLRNVGTTDPLDIKASGQIRTASAQRLMQMAGLQPAVPDSTPASLSVTIAGTLADGFLGDLQLDAYGGKYLYNGTIKPLAPGFGLDGKLALRSTNAGALVAALGLPSATLPSGVFVLDSTVMAKDGAIAFPDIDGRLGEGRISGSLALDAARNVTGTVETGALALSDVLAATFLDWKGEAPGLDSGFMAALPFGLTGEVWITPQSLAVHEQLIAGEVQIGITAAREEVRLALRGKDPLSRDIHIEIGSAGEGAVRKISGRMTIPVELASQLRLAGGQPVAEGQGMLELGFTSEGRSPGGALATLKGSGSYSFESVRLPGLSPAAFLSAIAEARDSAGLTAAFDALRGGEGLQAATVSGTIVASNGEVAFLPFVITTPEAKATVKVFAELGTGEIDATAALSFTAREDLPGMSVTYAGPPSALARSEDNAELSTKLGITLMQQGVDELERLQKEQERLAAEEEKQRLIDQARLEAYYAQRDELILRKRELKVHAEMRVLEAERLRQKIESERAANLEINKSELKQRVREIRVLRRLARLDRASGDVPPPAKPKPKQVAKPAAPAKPKVAGPLILVQPEGAPVIISAPPSPSQ